MCKANVRQTNLRKRNVRKRIGSTFSEREAGIVYCRRVSPKIINKHQTTVRVLYGLSPYGKYKRRKDEDTYHTLKTALSIKHTLYNRWFGGASRVYVGQHVCVCCRKKEKRRKMRCSDIIIFSTAPESVVRFCFCFFS